MSEPRILTLDLETSPTLTYVWSQKPNYIPIEMVVDPTRVLCFAAKWLSPWVDDDGFEHGTAVQFFSEYDFTDAVSRPECRRIMVESAWELLCQADAVVTYNGDNFDIPHLYREFQEAGLGPVSPFKSFDLYKAAKKARFFSHKLQHVSTQLGQKGKHNAGGFQTWKDVLAGDDKAWRKFRWYNKRDVLQTEELFLTYRPWMTKLNVGLFHDGGEHCSKCASINLQRRGWRYTDAGKYQIVFCKDCGGWSTLAKRESTTELRSV